MSNPVSERKLTVEDARQSLTAHAADKGTQLREKYGPHIGWRELKQAMEDRSVVRYPCEIIFDSSGLLHGEMAHPFPIEPPAAASPAGDTAESRSPLPEDGFRLHVNPIYMADLDSAVAIVLYQLVLVNYGEFACADDAEAFGAAALGISPDDYYTLLCDLSCRLEPAGCSH